MDFLNLNESVKTAIGIAKSIAREYGNEMYTPAHLLKALLHREVGLQSFVRYLGKDISYFEEWAEIRINDCPKVGAPADINGDEKIPVVFESADDVRLKLGLLGLNPTMLSTDASK
jgi:ATP-dependent Clp protease ATP-binding subunit ClpA